MFVSSLSTAHHVLEDSSGPFAMSNTFCVPAGNVNTHGVPGSGIQSGDYSAELELVRMKR